MTTQDPQYLFVETGNGFPQDGDRVLIRDDQWGDHRVGVVARTSQIHTGQALAGQANYLYLTLVDDATEDCEDGDWEALHHVSEHATLDDAGIDVA